MKLKQLFMPLTGLALISLAGPSYPYYDSKFQPGSACKPSEGTQIGDFLSLERDFQQQRIEAIRGLPDRAR